MAKIKKKINENDKKVFVVAQDIKLAKVLAGNNKRLRERTLRNLKKWFQHRSSKMPFTEQDFMRIWKGLFYTMWMSDKPLAQEQCAENISQLLHFSSWDASLLFFKCALNTLIAEWFGIDQLRLDKFLMLLRRILRRAFEVLKNENWDTEVVEHFNAILAGTVLDIGRNPPVGLVMHVVEIYLEELAKVCEGKIKPETTTLLLIPFVKEMVKLDDQRYISHFTRHIFRHLLRQSDAGLEYEERFAAWRDRGFPGGTIDAMQKEEVSMDEDSPIEDDESEDNSDTQMVLDPRAGQVDVVLRQISFDASAIAELLLSNKFTEGSKTNARKAITKLAKEFEELSEGNFPLGIKKVSLPQSEGPSTKLKSSMIRLAEFEEELLHDSAKNRKRKKLVEPVENEAALTKTKRRKLPKSGNDEECNGNLTDVFQEKLERFIQESEGGVIKRKSPGKKRERASFDNLKAQVFDGSLLDNIRPRRRASYQPDSSKWQLEAHFRRNSGTWYVYSENEDSLTEDQVPIRQKTDKLSLQNVEKPTSPGSPTKTRRKIINRTELGEDGSLFPQSDWDLPLKDGEIEIFVPANSYKKKAERLTELRGKNSLSKRVSLDSRLVKNPFSDSSTPNSTKKVKIDLMLNQSQEIHEHHEQLRNSPAIPFDANKKPAKPLLKVTGISSPINPFYKRKLNL